MLSVIPIDEPDRWDCVVRSFGRYDVYYLSGYAKTFQHHGDGEPLLFYYESNRFKAINAVMKRDIAALPQFRGDISPGQYFDLITPYGYGGFLIEGVAGEEEVSSMDEAYSEYCMKSRIISEYVRFHPILKNREKLTGMYHIEDIGNTVSIDLASLNGIWRNLSAKNRNVIRKAQKSGVEIYWGRNPELIRCFEQMYQSTMDKNNADGYYYFEKPFYNSVLHDLKNCCMVFYALYQEKVIAMSIILYGNRQLHYHLSASDPLYRNLAPTNLLLYEAACWGCENHCQTFHLGGGRHSRKDNLYHFKKAFYTGEDAIYSVGKKLFLIDVYHKLVSIRSAEKDFDCGSGFFPLYRQ